MGDQLFYKKADSCRAGSKGRPFSWLQDRGTQSIDYAIVLSGEIDMELEEGEEIRLKAGDVLIQRATIHNWFNRGKEPCIIAFILIGLEGGKSTGWL